MKQLTYLLGLSLMLFMTACDDLDDFEPAPSADVEEGIASYYADKFQGRPTASGEPFDQNKLTAAHKTLPFGTRVLVTNKKNGKTVEVRINDRGPFVKGRIIDLSKRAARQIDMIQDGIVPVTVEVLGVQ